MELIRAPYQAEVVESDRRITQTWLKYLQSITPGAGGPVSGSGTVNTIPLWTPNGSTLGDSIASQAAGRIRVDGGLLVEAVNTSGMFANKQSLDRDTVIGSGVSAFVVGDWTIPTGFDFEVESGASFMVVEI